MNQRIFLFSILILGAILTSSKPDKKYFTESARPQYHYSLEENRLGQPTGVFFKDSLYYLFFNCNMQSRLKRNNGMACATSKDLVHWKHNGEIFDINFADGDTTAKLDWSGSVVLDSENTSGLGSTEEPPVLAFFTGKENRQYMAHGTLTGKWEVIPEPLEVGDGFCGSPKVFYHSKSSKWVMVLSQRNRKSVNVSRIYFYTSDNLKEWTLSSTQTNLPECSSIFKISDDNGELRWVYAAADGKFILGEFDGKAFIPQLNNLSLDYGNSFHGLCVIHRDGKDILINGLKGGKFQNMPFAGQLGFPTEMKLVAKGGMPKIIRTPVEALKVIRKKGIIKTDKNLIPGLKNNNLVSSIKGKELYLSSTIQLKSANQIAYVVRKGKKSNGVEIIYEFLRAEKPVKTMSVGGYSMKVDPLEGGKIKIDLLIDRSSLEVFVNDGEYVFSLITDDPELGKDLILLNMGGEVFVENVLVDKTVSVWETYRTKK